MMADQWNFGQSTHSYTKKYFQKNVDGCFAVFPSTSDYIEWQRVQYFKLNILAVQVLT
jgi:hypothetical protein